MSLVNKFPSELLLIIFNALPSVEDVHQCSMVNRRWRQLSLDDHVWLFDFSFSIDLWDSNWCNAYWVPPVHGDKENWKDREKERFTRHAGPGSIKAFMKWHSLLKGFNELYPRMKGLIYRLSVWLRANTPQTLVSLLPGRSADWTIALEQFVEHLAIPKLTLKQLRNENAEEWNLLREFLMFYHFFDGQKPKSPHLDLGLFGCYTCYGQFVSLFMLPMKYLRVETVFDFRLIIFAVCPRSGKFFALVVDAPEALKPSTLFRVVEVGGMNGRYIIKGAFLGWLENYVVGLENGLYDVQEVINRDFVGRAISMFRNTGPGTSRSVARGISIEASSLPCIEAGTRNGVWVYRIKLNFVGGNGSVPQCQLLRRHWVVQYRSGFVDRISGDGIVGHNPVLSASSPNFVYCSMCAGRELGLDQAAVAVRRRRTNDSGTSLRSRSSRNANENSGSSVASNRHRDMSSTASSNSSVPNHPRTMLAHTTLTPETENMDLDNDGFDSEGDTDPEDLDEFTVFDPPLSMEGEFEFVPGTIEQPAPQPHFLVPIAKFTFLQPKESSSSSLK